MHLLRTQARTSAEAEAAIDLGQTPAALVCLSFSDSDLGALATSAEAEPGVFGLRLASLAQLRHPYSVDLYVDGVASRARFVLVRLLGGLDYWRYGVDELARAARAHRFDLAIVPGDHREDARLDAASTLATADLRRLWHYFQEGGAANMGSLLRWIDHRLGAAAAWEEPVPLAAAGRYEGACRAGRSFTHQACSGHAFITFYRSQVLAGDCAPIEALADALAARGLAVTALHVTSLKDERAAAIVREAIATARPDVILNTTAFSARTDAGPSVLDDADAPVLQVILAGSTQAQWRADPRGLGAADLAMNVVLPEMDGRLVTTAISCKAETPRSPALEFTRLVHAPIASRVAHVAAMAAAWVRLRRTPASDRRIACILSDYPGRGGREGYAVGLDTPASVTAIASALRDAGYAIGALPATDDLMAVLTTTLAHLPLATYRRWFAALPEAFAATVRRHWGDPGSDLEDGAQTFAFKGLQAGTFLLALQPDRGSRSMRKSEYHDTALPPCHAYIAFYLWLRHDRDVHAVLQCGTHGTLEWLPGKPVALDADCAPEALLGATPLIYPFIVNNPGEAAQAKRRNAAVTIGHMTPPLIEAGLPGAAADLEALFDEYAQAESLDPRRARLIARTILAQAEESGLAQESRLQAGPDRRTPEAALVRLDAWLCDVKDMRIRDGLHVFGRMPVGPSSDTGDTAARTACAAGEIAGLLAALDGRFVSGGPAGAPSRGRLDVMPTGRNLYSTDPRQVPSRTACEIGRRAADEVASRHAQDHGDWPRRIVMDMWASATMRTGGEDLGQAMAHLGVRPLWDHATARVAGFEILPFASLERPRVDVTLRISGLFRDVFPAQIALFDQAVRAVADLDETDDINPLAAARRAGTDPMHRLFGAAPALYGIGLGRAMAEDPMIARETLGAAYLAAGSHAYGGSAATATPSGAAFSARVAAADAFVHAQDMADLDLLDAAASVEAEGGFAAGAESLGRKPALYHLDMSRPDRAVARTLAEEVARVVRGRAANPAWIAGQMRHGHRGAADIAETVDNLFAMAVLSDAVVSRHFDLVYAATCGTPAVRDFLLRANRDAALAIAARFQDAARRGLWSSRRNSDAATLAAMTERAA